MQGQVSRQRSAMFSTLSITKQDKWIIAYIDGFMGGIQNNKTSTPAAEISCDICETDVK